MTEELKLQTEKKVLETHINEWRISHLGEFVLIKDTEVIGFFPTLDSAFNEGLQKFGIKPFLVDQILPIQTVNVTFYGKAN